MLDYGKEIRTLRDKKKKKFELSCCPKKKF